ncbi:hypothetical protein HN51_016687 [Arachis hypogaea]
MWSRLETLVDETQYRKLIDRLMRKAIRNHIFRRYIILFLGVQDPNQKILAIIIQLYRENVSAYFRRKD